MSEVDSPESARLPEDGVDAAWICARYEAARARLPQASFPAKAQPAASLLAIADEFDAFLMDAFGVLNVGLEAIPGAAATISAIQASGKRVMVLTNGATLPRAAAVEKYRGWGFQFEADDVISSRDLLVARMKQAGTGRTWGITAPGYANIGELPGTTLALGDEASVYESVDGFVLLSSRGWSPGRQALLERSLRNRARPVLVGNPDVAAPYVGGFSLEPGYFAHQVADNLGIEPEFFGKPFGNAFDEARRRLHGATISPRRMAMVGDSLHTDILGGAAAGMSTVLVTGHGLFKGQRSEDYIRASGIVPDFVVPTT